MLLFSPIYKDVTDILKPIFDRFKGKDIFLKVDKTLTENPHNNIFKDFGGVITDVSNKETSEIIIFDVRDKLEELT